MKILVVEDDPRMAALLERGLRSEGHVVYLASNGEAGLEYAKVHPYDIVILDVMLPRLSGLEVLRRLREARSSTPVLMLTARDAKKDVADGLDSGADDYLTKPFAFEELLARIRAVVRRGPVTRTVTRQNGDLSLNPATHEVRRNGNEIHLTRTEFQLLDLLMRRSGQVVSRAVIVEAVWGNNTNIEMNTVDAFIGALRRKLSDNEQPRLIETIRGVGFRLRKSGR